MVKNKIKVIFFLFLIFVLSTFVYGFDLHNTENRGEIQGTVGTLNGDQLWSGYNQGGIPNKIIQDSTRFDVSNLSGVIKDIFKDRDNSGIVDSGNIASNILITQDDSEIWISFVNEDAGYHNTLAYYIYKKGEIPDSLESANLIFPNIDKDKLYEGDTIYLGKFEKDTVIGWFLVSDGWVEGAVDIAKPKLYSNKQWNNNGFQQMALMEFFEEGKQKLILAVEDTERPNGDKDYNDLIFCVTSNNRLVPEEGEFVSDDWTAFSVKGKIELDGSSYIDGLTGTNANQKLGVTKPIIMKGTSWIGESGHLNHELLKVGYKETEAFYDVAEIIEIPDWWVNGDSYQKEFWKAIDNNTIQKLSAFYNKSIDYSWFDIDIPDGNFLDTFGDISTGTINHSGKYSKIEVNRTLDIEVGNSDILLVVDELSMLGNAKIDITRLEGTLGKLFIVVNNDFSIGGEGIFANMDDVYIYYRGSDELNINGSTQLKASLYIDRADLKLNGSGSIIGKEIVTKGQTVELGGAGISLGNLYGLDTAIYLSGSANIDGILTGGKKVQVNGGTGMLKYIYAPESDIELLESAKLEGFVIGGNIKLTGRSYIKKGDAELVEPNWPIYVSIPDVDLISPTVDTLILNNANIDVEANINDLDGDTVSVKLYLNGEYVAGSEKTINGKGTYTYSLETNDEFKNKIHLIKVMATDEDGNSSSDEVSIYIPDDEIKLEITSPSGEYLKSDAEGIILEFLVSSNYKKMENGEIKNQEIKEPIVSFTLENGEVISSDNVDLKEAFNFSYEDIKDEENIINRKYKVKIPSYKKYYQSIHKKLLLSENIDLSVRVLTEDEKIKVEKNKNVKLNKPIVTKVTINNLTSEVFFKSLLDEKGNKIYTESPDICYEENTDIGTSIDSSVYVKEGDQLQFTFEYTDLNAEYLSDYEVRRRFQISCFESVSICGYHMERDGTNMKVSYKYNFEGMKSGATDILKFGFNLRDINNNCADFSEIKLKLSSQPSNVSLDLAEKNVFDGKNYVGNNHSLIYKIKEVSRDTLLYLYIFTYDWTKSDLESEPSIKLLNSKNNKYYFASKYPVVALNKIDGFYKVDVVPIGFAGDNKTGKNNLDEIISAINNYNFEYYVDTIAPKVSSSKIIKTKEGTYEELLKDFFKNGIINENYYKSGDSVSIEIGFSEKNIFNYEIKIGNEAQKVSILDGLRLKTGDYKAGDNGIQAYCKIADRAGNETTENGDSLKINFDTETAGRISVDSDLKDSSNEYKFVNNNISLKSSGSQPSYLVATGNNTGSNYGGENFAYLCDLKNKDGVMFLPCEGENAINFYSFSRSGKRSDSNDKVFVDKNINYNGVLKKEKNIQYESSGNYKDVVLDFDEVTEFVGLASYEIINLTGVSGETSGTLTPENPLSTILIGGVDKKPEISFVHNVPSNKVLKIKFIDKLGNEKIIDYEISIGSQIEIIGKKSGENKNIKSVIEIGNVEDIKIRSRK